MTHDDPAPTSMGLRVIQVLAIGLSVVVGFGLILVAATFGRCDAFGGRCPADQPALFDDDAFGMAAFGTAILVAVPVFLYRPSVRRLGVAVVSGLFAALIVGLLVRSSVHG